MSYFDKFVQDLNKRSQEKRVKTPTEKEIEYQEQRRQRVRIYQERWQNSIRWIPGKKK